MSKISRRKFLQISALAGGATMLPMPVRWLGRNPAYAFSNSIALQKFIQPLPLFGSTQLPLAAKNPIQPYTGVDYYQITAGVYRQQLHPGLPTTGTRLYGYSDYTGKNVHLGAAILAKQGTPVRFGLTSNLPASHIIPFDNTIPMPGNGGMRQDRAAVHLHGGLVPWPSDGGPFHWQANPNNGGSAVGASVTPWLANTTGTNVWEYYYPNLQSGRLMWYHDHAIGITRTNAYAGLATGYVLDDGVATSLGLPFSNPLVFQDKIFWNPASDPNFAKYVTGAQAGDLWYPYLYETARWGLAKGGVPPIPSCIPEFFADTLLVNGMVYPYHNVDAGMYRFYLLNAQNARFMRMVFVVENPNQPGEPKFASDSKPVLAPVKVWQIGNEGGLLPKPVLLANGTVQTPLLLGPAERADLVIDFSSCAGMKVLIYNDAPAPFPGGATINDYYPGNKQNPVPTKPGWGPNTRTPLQFRVSAAAGPHINIPTTIPVAFVPTVPDTANGGLMIDTAALARAFPGYAYDPRPVDLTLNEVFDKPYGRLQQLVGTNVFNPASGSFGKYYLDAPTETVQYKTIRIWRIFNTTADTHPMHFHLFNVQVLARRRFNPKGYTGTANFTSIGVTPDPNEMGFKETVRMNPGECTIVALVVDDPLPTPVYGRDAAGRPTIPVTPAGGTVTYNSSVPFSPRLQQFGLNADEYVWHCHILEHEEHDMMRPLVGSY